MNPVPRYRQRYLTIRIVSLELYDVSYDPQFSAQFTPKTVSSEARSRYSVPNDNLDRWDGRQNATSLRKLEFGLEKGVEIPTFSGRQ